MEREICGLRRGEDRKSRAPLASSVTWMFGLLVTPKRAWV